MNAMCVCERVAVFLTRTTKALTLCASRFLTFVNEGIIIIVMVIITIIVAQK